MSNLQKIIKKFFNSFYYLFPKFLRKKIKKKFFPYYFYYTDFTKLPASNYVNNNHYEIQEKLILQFKLDQKQNSFMTCPYLHNLLLMKFSTDESFSFLDIGGEYIDFFLKLKKNFKNVKYFLFNLDKINDNFEKIKKKYDYKDLIIIKDLNLALNTNYDFVNFGSCIQYFDNYEHILENIPRISNNIFFSGTTLFESNLENYNKHIIAKQTNCFPDINYCYFFNKKFFYSFFFKKKFNLLFENKNLTDNINYNNFKNISYKVEYLDFYFVKKKN